MSAEATDLDDIEARARDLTATGLAGMPAAAEAIADAIRAAIPGNAPDVDHARLILDGLLDLDQVKNLPPPEPLIEGVLEVDTVALIYAPSGSYKTFVALDMALSIGYGIDWHNHTVKAGPVLYIAAESVAGIGIRVKAWDKARQHRIVDVAPHPVKFWPKPLDMTSTLWIDGLVRAVAELKPALVVFDTLARCATGADENSAKDMGLLVDAIDQVRRSCGCTCLIVHHTGKETGNGARGSSALRAAVDTELELTANGAFVTVKSTKQKNSAPIDPIRLAALPVDGTDSLSIENSDGVNLHDLGGKDSDVLAALRRIDMPGGVTAADWGAAAELSKSRILTYANVFVAAGEVVRTGTGRSTRYELGSEEGTEQ